MTRIFYLAASYSMRSKAITLANEIETYSGWTCNSRWLREDHSKLPDEAVASIDYKDLYRADVLIFVGKEASTKGGMWVEFGLALAWKKPIVIFSEEGISTPAGSVFLSFAENFGVGVEGVIQCLIRSEELK